MALTTDLEAYYKLDGNSDDSVGSNDWTDSNITYVTWKINNCADFNGSSWKITIDESSLPLWSSDRTIYTRIKSDANNWIIWSYGQRGWIRKMMSLGISATGYLTVYNYWADYTTTQLITPWTRYFVLVTYNGTEEEVFVGDTSIWTYTVALDTTASVNFTLGNFPNVGAGGRYDGLIDEVWIMSRVATSTEITELYNSWDGLQYPFTSTANTTAFFQLF